MSSSTPEQFETLIPGLPNDVSSLILICIPYSHHARLRSTCRSWRAFLSSNDLIALRRVHLPPSRLFDHLCLFPGDPSTVPPLLFDPRASAWLPLPPMPCDPHAYGRCNFAAVAPGPSLYVLGGSLFDTRSFPIDRPSPSAAVFRFDVAAASWRCLAPMLSPRGSFACAATPTQIFVAGGGSRHVVFSAAGSRMRSVERYDVTRNQWAPLDGLPLSRAGCAGFLVKNCGEEFWVMGGYGEPRIVAGMFPVDEHYRDAVVMELNNGGRWREIGDMWEEGERGRRLGKIVLLDEDWAAPRVFMLDGSDIFSYDMASNRWNLESSVPIKARNTVDYGFVALDGELYVMTLLSEIYSAEICWLRHQKRSMMLYIQIYHPRKQTWRSVVTKPPLNDPVDFKSAVMCTIRL